jgi:hypothetical protein
LDETIWSLTSPLVKRISGSKNFRSSPQKDLCNKIGHQQTHAPRQIAPYSVAIGMIAKIESPLDGLSGRAEGGRLR